MSSKISWWEYPLQTNWFTVIIQALLSVSIDLPRELRPSKKQPRMFFLSPTHTACPSSVCNALTSLRAASKLLFSEVSQIENEGNQMRTTRSSQRRDAESTQSQLKNSVCSVFFFFPVVFARVTSNILHLYELRLRCLRWDLWRF